MNANIPKQYLMLGAHPVIYYSLKAFENSAVEDIILVTGSEDVEFCQKEIVDKYGLTKVRAVVPGGEQRYHSVFCGLEELKKRGGPPCRQHNGGISLVFHLNVPPISDSARM